jgi:hypothetical protein
MRFYDSIVNSKLTVFLKDIISVSNEHKDYFYCLNRFYIYTNRNYSNPQNLDSMMNAAQ